MSGFTLLWSKTLDSSLWVKESKETRLVWMTLMMMKDKDGIVHASIVGLASRARVTEDECAEALRILLSPDQHDTSKVEQGRRLREVPGGWQLVNHDLYRFSTPERREFWRIQKAEQRAKMEGRKKKPRQRTSAAVSASYEAGESEHEKAFNRGASQAELDAIQTRRLPEQCQ